MLNPLNIWDVSCVYTQPTAITSYVNAIFDATIVALQLKRQIITPREKAQLNDPLHMDTV